MKAQDIDDLEASFIDSRREYLRSNGWTHTSTTPGFYWMWVISMPNNQDILVEESFAFTIQKNIEEGNISAEHYSPKKTE